VIEDELTPCRYGFALLRFIHKIAALRAIYPAARILLSKFDFKSAYRRVHFRAKSALQSCITTKGLGGLDLALVSLRTTVGGSPCPLIFSEISETVTDLTNAIIRCSDNDPASFPSHYSHLLGPAKVEPDDVPLAAACSLMIDPEADKFGTADVFLDDIFSAIPQLDGDSPRDRGAQAALLALDVVGRPLLLDGGESLPRDEVLAINKAIAEGTPATRLIVLGWMIDTRRLLISLPTDKFTAWTADINDFLLSKGRRVKLRTLDTMVGRLQHVANIMVQGNHFLGRLRSVVLLADKFKGTRLSSKEMKDLVLWKDFLVVAHTGIDLNLLTTREPNNILRTDACEHGLGGYSLKTGRAWRWEIPLHLRGRKSINFLEFLACVVGNAQHQGGRSSSWLLLP